MLPVTHLSHMLKFGSQMLWMRPAPLLRCIPNHSCNRSSRCRRGGVGIVRWIGTGSL